MRGSLALQALVAGLPAGGELLIQQNRRRVSLMKPAPLGAWRVYESQWYL